MTVAQEIADEQLDEVYDALSDFVARFTVEHVVLFERDADGNWAWRAQFPLGG